ncbi:MAG: DUF4394 domain-containing protein [Sporichthyaceae bacterium]
MKVLPTIAAAAAVGGLLLATAPLAGAASRAGDCGRGNGLQVVGLTSGNELVCFRANSPGSARSIGKVTGLESGDKLVGIDYRPSNGKLYALAGDGSLYTVNDRNARATKDAQLDLGSAGAAFGFDFNPAADALRIVAASGQNLRYTISAPTPATVIDGPLTNPAVAPATGTVPATDVTGAAYTNNDNDPDTATTLFDIDAALDRVALQSPANAGTLAPTGKLGVDTTTAVGFDIHSKLRGGQAVNNSAFASLTVNGRGGFYAIDLLTGDARRLGEFGKRTIVGIALPLNQR